MSNININPIEGLKVKEKTMVQLIEEECNNVKEILLEKNRSYGNSVSDPIHIFSSSDNIEQIKVRIDDKLARIARGSEYKNEDTELDIIGYLILKRILCKKQDVSRDI